MPWAYPVLLFFLFFASESPATTNQQVFMEQFRSGRVFFPEQDSPFMSSSPGRYPEVLNFLFGSVLGWTPEGRVKKVSPGCEAKVWGQRLRDPRIVASPALQGAVVQKYFQDCGAEIGTGTDAPWLNSLRMMTMKLSPLEHPFLHPVVIHLPGNIKLKGLLGLKGDRKVRPLVVVRLGIFSSVGDFKPERAWMMMLFEQSPFNILLLENMTSPDFVANNSQFSFGGYDEGIQNIQVAKLLTSPDEPLSRLVDSIHFFGVSLGGHGVLFASLLNKYNSPADRPLISSFTTLCPVLNLQPTMEALTQDGIKSSLVNLWSRQRLQGLDAKLGGFQKQSSWTYLPEAISEVVRTYKGALSYVSSVQLPPGMKDGSNFWALNDFWKFYDHVDQSVIVYATTQDPAVPFALNSGLLQSRKMRIESKNIRVVELPKGIHCTLPVAYDWSVWATLFQSSILAHSPRFKMTEQTLDVDLSDEDWRSFAHESAQLSFSVQKLREGKSFVPLQIRILNSSGVAKSLSISLPLSRFDFRFLNTELSPSELDMIRRWLNQNLALKIISDSGKARLRISWSVAL